MSEPIVRAAAGADAEAVAELLLRSRRAATGIPPTIHDDDEVHSWVRERLVPSGVVWVVASGDALVAVMALEGEWVDQLYVAPEHLRRGHGSCLLKFAQSQRSELGLWTFEANTSARAFYEAHGFELTGPASSDNEERAPALCYHWTVPRA